MQTLRRLLIALSDSVTCASEAKSKVLKIRGKKDLWEAARLTVARRDENE